MTQIKGSVQLGDFSGKYSGMGTEKAEWELGSRKIAHLDIPQIKMSFVKFSIHCYFPLTNIIQLSLTARCRENFPFHFLSIYP